MLDIKGFSNYYFDGHSFYSKNRSVSRSGAKGSFRLEGQKITVTKDKGAGYCRVMMVDDNKKRRNLLLHRLVYAVNNGLEYGFKGKCYHYNGDRNNNNITNIYLGEMSDSVKDKQLSQGLLKAYKDGNLEAFLFDAGYYERQVD